MFKLNNFLSYWREEKRSQRKKVRQEKRKKEQTKKDLYEVFVDNSDLVDTAGQDKSFDSISSFTGDVTDKVGNVGNSVTSGVTVSLLNCKTETGFSILINIIIQIKKIKLFFSEYLATSQI